MRLRGSLLYEVVFFYFCKDLCARVGLPNTINNIFLKKFLIV